MYKLSKDIQYNKHIPLNAVDDYGQIYTFNLERTYFKNEKVDQYFIKAYTHIGDRNTCAGYIYFYLDFDNKASSFIGIFVNEEFRSKGISSKLIAYWLKLCYENGIDKLNTNQRQRKPFLLFVLKKFGFDIEDPELYTTSPHTIYICKKSASNKKYLLFKNDAQKLTFLNGPIFRKDNYIVLNQEDRRFPIIDNVLLSHPYELNDANRAVKKMSSYF